MPLTSLICRLDSSAVSAKVVLACVDDTTKSAQTGNGLICPVSQPDRSTCAALPVHEQTAPCPDFLNCLAIGVGTEQENKLVIPGISFLKSEKSVLV